MARIVTSTLAIIKPDAMAAGLKDVIVDRIISEGFRILRIDTKQIMPDEAQSLYAEHVGRSFYSDLIDFTTSGPSMVMVLQREYAVERWRDVLGATDSRLAMSGTLRSTYGNNGSFCGSCGGCGSATEGGLHGPCSSCAGTGHVNNIIYRNVAHGSDSNTSARREIRIFFGEISTGMIREVEAELLRARAKFPGNRFLLAALVEEVGELADAIVVGQRERIHEEAVQVCCVAIRIAEEDDATKYDVDGFVRMISAVGEVARCLLQRKGASLAIGIAHGVLLRLSRIEDPTFNDITDEEAKP